MKSLFFTTHHIDTTILIQKTLVNMLSDLYPYVSDKDSYNDFYNTLDIVIPGYFVQNNIQAYTGYRTKKAEIFSQEDIDAYIKSTFKPRFVPETFKNVSKESGIVVPYAAIEPMKAEEPGTNYIEKAFDNYFFTWAVRQYMYDLRSYLISECEKSWNLRTVSPVQHILEKSLTFLWLDSHRDIIAIHKNLLMFSALSQDLNRIKTAIEIVCKYNLISEDNTPFNLHKHISHNHNEQSGYCLSDHEILFRSQLTTAHETITGNTK